MLVDTSETPIGNPVGVFMFLELEAGSHDERVVYRLHRLLRARLPLGARTAGGAGRQQLRPAW